MGEGEVAQDAAAGPTSASTPTPVPYVWYVIFLLTLVNACNMMDRMALAVLAPFVKTDLHLSDAQLGLLTGFAFALFYALCGVPIARWADRGVRRSIIALAIATWSVMTALSGAAQNFWHLLIARIGVGAGEAGSYSPGASILCDYVPLQRRPGVFALHTFGLVAGLMLGMALAGGLSGIIGWRWTFVALGLPGIALAVVVRFSLREPVRGSLDAPWEGTADLSLVQTLRILWACRTYRLLVLYLIVNGFVQSGLQQWWPSFYSRVLGVSLGSVGIHLGLALGIGMGVGLLVGGLIGNNRSARHDPRIPLMVCAGVTLLALPASVGSLFVASAWDSMVLASLAGLFWSVASGPLMATVYSVTAASMRATAGAVLTFFVSALGIGLGPFCVGVLSDILLPTFGVASLRYALLAPVCLLPVMVFALLAATRTLRDDLGAMGARAADLAQPAVRPELAIAN